MNKIEEIIRGYHQGDEKGIIKLHQDVFHSDLDVNRWKWQFIDGHPKGRSWIALVQSGSEIVGQNCMMRHHLNFNGQEITAGQSCDTMVRLDQRGKGWSVELVTASSTVARKDGAKAVFGFPNRNSYPARMKHLAWLRLFRLNYYYYRLGYEKFIGRHADIFFRYFSKLKAQFERQINIIYGTNDFLITTFETLPLELNDFIKEINTYEVLSVWKDLGYLRWRYENHPHNKYLFHLLKIKGKNECLIVTKRGINDLHICEVLSRTKNFQQALLVVGYVVLYAIKAKAQKIDFYGYDNGFFDTLFSRAKFNKETSNFIFCGRSLQKNEFSYMFNMPSNWTISVGDTDVI